MTDREAAIRDALQGEKYGRPTPRSDIHWLLAELAELREQLRVSRVASIRERDARHEAEAELAAAREREQATLNMIRRMARYGVGPDTPPQKCLDTIGTYVEKKLAENAALDATERQA